MKVAKENPAVKEVYLHVQTNNDAARKFYTDFKFEEAEVIPNYYKRIEPADCYLLRYTINREVETLTNSSSDVDPKE